MRTVATTIGSLMITMVSIGQVLTLSLDHFVMGDTIHIDEFEKVDRLVLHGAPEDFKISEYKIAYLTADSSLKEFRIETDEVLVNVKRALREEEDEAFRTLYVEDCMIRGPNRTMHRVGAHVFVIAY